MFRSSIFVFIGSSCKDLVRTTIPSEVRAINSSPELACSQRNTWKPPFSFAADSKRCLATEWQHCTRANCASCTRPLCAHPCPPRADLILVVTNSICNRKTHCVAQRSSRQFTSLRKVTRPWRPRCVTSLQSCSAVQLTFAPLGGTACAMMDREELSLPTLVSTLPWLIALEKQSSTDTSRACSSRSCYGQDSFSDLQRELSTKICEGDGVDRAQHVRMRWDRRHVSISMALGSPPLMHQTRRPRQQARSFTSIFDFAFLSCEVLQRTCGETRRPVGCS